MPCVCRLQTLYVCLCMCVCVRLTISKIERGETRFMKGRERKRKKEMAKSISTKESHVYCVRSVKDGRRVQDVPFTSIPGFGYTILRRHEAKSPTVYTGDHAPKPEPLRDRVLFPIKRFVRPNGKGWNCISATFSPSSLTLCESAICGTCLSFVLLLQPQ